MSGTEWRSLAPLKSTDLILIEIFTPIPEEPPRAAVSFQEIEIEGMYQHTLCICAKGLHKVATMVGNEGVPVKGLRGAESLFCPDPVGGYDGHDIRHGVTLHRAAPGSGCIKRLVVWFAPDRGREK